MGTLEITLRLHETGTPPVVAEYIPSAEGALPWRAEGALALDTAALLQAANDPRAYGRILGEALFQGEIGGLFDQALGDARGDRLRLLLFVEHEALRAYRWERLCAYVEGDWQPLATYQPIPFSRYLPSQTDRRFPPIARHDLRALIVAASPARSTDWGLPPFDVAAAVAGITAAYEAAGVPCTLFSTGPGAAGPPTLKAICAEITRARTTALHIVAHGRALEDGPVVYLSHAEHPDEVDAVTASRLIDSLNDLQSPFGLPHLVFLCACESAQEQHNGALGGLGQRLVQHLGTPAVVAMADRVSVETATALATAFYGHLLAPDGDAPGEVDVALVRATAGLAEREDVTVPVLYQRLGARPLFTPSAQRDPTPDEVAAGLARLAAEVDRRAPVLRPELDRAAGVVRTYLATSEADLSPAARDELAQARAAVKTICAEAVELSFEALATGAALSLYKGDTCPFPGLTAFAEPQQAFFFGRNALIDTMAAQLERGRFLAVAGASGSGKSSAVLAGLVPRLRKERPGVGVAYCTPGNLPLANLTFAVNAAQQGGTTDLIVVVDQFEELFLLGQSEDADADANERLPFITALARLAAEQTVVITLQSEYLEQCRPYPTLAALMADAVVQVPPLSAEELREVIEQQATAVGLRFEGGLTTIILRDVSDERGVMPLAQHALRELWQRRRGRWLRSAEYERLGGVKESIARTADQIFARHDRAAQDCLREIFLRLTRLDRDAGPGDEPEDTRRRVRLADLVPHDEHPEQVEGLLRELIEARLVVRNGATVELAHEALIRSWRQLRQWIAADRPILLQFESFGQDALKWDNDNRGKDHLWTGNQLAHAKALAELPRLKLNATERAFLDAAITAQDDQLAHERQLRAQAEEQRKRAEDEAQRARTAEEEAQKKKREAEYARQLAEQYASQAIAERTRAQDNQKRAEEEAGKAEEQRKRAEEKEALAVAEAQRAHAAEERLRRRFWVVASLAAVASLLSGIVLFLLVENSERTRLAEVDAALALGDTDQVLRLAGQATDDVRLNAALTKVAREGARRVHRDFSAIVWTTAFSPDGATYLAGSNDGSVKIWDTATGELVRSFRYTDGEEPGSVVEAIYAPSGPIIGTADGTIVAVGAADGRPFEERTAGEILALAASPDGAQLLTADISGVAALWDIASGRRLRTVLSVTGEAVQDVGYLDGGRGAFAVTNGGTVVVYDTATWAERTTFELRRPDALDFDGDSLPDACTVQVADGLPLAGGDHLLVGCNDGSLEEWTADGFFAGAFIGHDAPILEVAVVRGPAGATGVLSASYDQTVRLWEYPSRQQARLFVGHDSEANGVAVSPDGAWFVSGSFDRTARLWDMRSGLREADYALADNAPMGVVRALALGGGQVVAADATGILARWGRAGGAPLQARKAPGRAVALSPDGSEAIVQLPDDQIAFWDVAEHREISSFPGMFPARPVAALSPDGAVGLVGLADGTVELHAADGALLHRLEAEPDLFPSTAAISSDGRRALIGYGNGSIGLWSVPDGARIGGFLNGHSDEVFAVAFSADGRRAISGSWDKEAIVWDLERGAELVRLRGHTRNVVTVALSPDGNLALTGSADRSVRLWQVSDGLELGRYGEEIWPVEVVAFDPADGTAVVGNTAGEVQRWRPLVGEQLWAWLRANRALP